MSRVAWPARGALIAGVALLLARALVFDLRWVGDDGMAPGLLPGELVLVSRRAAVEPGDVVLVRLGGDAQRYLKRVVAVEGETVEVAAGALRVDGHPLGTAAAGALPEGCPGSGARLVEEGRGGRSWLVLPGGSDAPADILGPGQLWVLGDHRGSTRDSRHWGPLDRGEVEGVVVARLLRERACDPVLTAGPTDLR